jgi:hypothetical protein
MHVQDDWYALLTHISEEIMLQILHNVWLDLCSCAAAVRVVDVGMPLAPYFSESLTHEDLDEMNIEVGGWEVWLV